jgi:hypothetical protein
LNEKRRSDLHVVCRAAHGACAEAASPEEHHAKEARSKLRERQEKKLTLEVFTLPCCLSFDGDIAENP